MQEKEIACHSKIGNYSHKCRPAAFGAGFTLIGLSFVADFDLVVSAVKHFK